jgi:hypothetical protein
MRTSNWLGLACAATIILPACGGDDSQAGAPVDGGTTDDGSSGYDSGGVVFDAAGVDAGDVATFCNGAYGALVRAFESCCSAADMSTAEYRFADGLLHLLISACETDLPGRIAKGRLSYDPQQAAMCIAAVQAELANYQCGVGINAPAMMGTSACKVVFTGLQPLNAPCGSDIDCQDGLTCIGYNVQMDGTCQQPPATGAVCGKAPTDGGTTTLSVNWNFGNHPDCTTGDYCPSIGGSKCQVQSGPGGSCGADNECFVGLTCHLGTCGTTGPTGVNTPCSSSTDCQKGLNCTYGDGGGTCEQKLPSGSACKGVLGGQCQGRCDVPDGGTTGTCVEFC